MPNVEIEYTQRFSAFAEVSKRSFENVLISFWAYFSILFVQCQYSSRKKKFTCPRSLYNKNGIYLSEKPLPTHAAWKVINL